MSTLLPAPDLTSCPSCLARQFDEAFLDKCRLMGFNPSRSKTSNLELLFRFGQTFGPGISSVEFRRIIRRCISCGNIIFFDKADSHSCSGTVVDVEVYGFDIVTTFLCSNGPNSGLTWVNLNSLLTVCDACERLVPEGTADFHDCPVLGRRYS